jgi:hypothetical protein
LYLRHSQEGAEEANADLRKIHYQELHDLYSPPNIITQYEMGMACGIYRGQKMCLQSFGGETRVKEDAWKPWTSLEAKY